MRYKILIPLLLILFISGCSKAFFYNRLDTLIAWYLDDYVELTELQEENFDERLNTILKWHRNEELLTYVSFLDEIENDLNKTVTINVVDDWAEQVYSAYERIEDKIIPLFYQTGEELNQEQIEAFMEKLWKRQTELEEEYLARTDKEYAEENQKRLIKNMSRLLGSLNSEQKAIIETGTQSLKRFDQAWLEERRIWYITLQELLNDQANWQQQFNDAYTIRKEIRTEKYNDYLQHNLKTNKLLIAKVLNSRTEKQNSHLMREINNYKNDFNAIIAKSKDSNAKIVKINQ